MNVENKVVKDLSSVLHSRATRGLFILKHLHTQKTHYNCAALSVCITHINALLK